ncbi:MAG: Ig-like domain-containing protein, partial [Planctomycetes bacterium]|nr:Ig-like domain-containing protein [Planctomycetota bacterium]
MSLELLETRDVPAGSQWASSVLGFSSQWSPGSWSAAQALGSPNTFAYGDIATAWAPLPINGSLEFITLGYSTPVYANRITIRETYGNGFVYQIDLLDTADVLHTVWGGTDPSQAGSPYHFTVDFPTTSFLVKGVKIYSNTDHNPAAWEEIDAVQLRGEGISNSAPTANNDSASTLQNTSVSINVLANDSDPNQDILTLSIASAPANGSAVV